MFLQFKQSYKEFSTMNNLNELVSRLQATDQNDDIMDETDLRSLAMLYLANPQCFDVTMSRNAFIRQVCKYNYPDVVQAILLDHRVDPAAQHSIALRIATLCGYKDIVSLLVQDGRSNPFDNGPQEESRSDPHWSFFYEETRLFKYGSAIESCMFHANEQKYEEIARVILSAPNVLSFRPYEQLDDYSRRIYDSL